MGLKSLLGRIPTILGRRTQTSEDWLDTPTYLRKNTSNDPEVYDVKEVQPNLDTWRKEQLENKRKEELKMAEDAVQKVVSPRVEMFEKVCESCEQLFEKKNAEYGDSITATGVLGASVELVGTVARLKKLVLQDPGNGKANISALADIFKDIHNYANIALMMMKEDNWSGK